MPKSFPTPIDYTAARRQREYRQRQRLGLRCLYIELNFQRLAEQLVATQRLAEAASDDTDAVALAAGRLLAEFCGRRR